MEKRNETGWFSVEGNIGSVNGLLSWGTRMTLTGWRGKEGFTISVYQRGKLKGEGLCPTGQKGRRRGAGIPQASVNNTQTEGKREDTYC